MTVLQVLKAAKRKINRPEKHCKGRYIDDDGRACALGAIYDLGTVDECFQARHVLAAAALLFGVPLVSKFNDAPTTTHADVMELYDVAIEMAKGAGI